MRSSPRSLSGITRTTTLPRSSGSTDCNTCRDSVTLLESKAAPEEVDEYRQFIVNLSHKVAAAHREHGQEVSEAEQSAINDINEALHATAG